MIQSELLHITELIAKLNAIDNLGNLHCCLVDLIGKLRDDLWCCLEYPYVDRMYRDAFYHFYSSKLDEYDRDCLRVSFFNKEIKKEFFFSKEGHTFLTDNFLGFSVLRLLPSKKNPGRTAISPKAFKMNNFICELTKIQASIRGAKLVVDAFPFSSQDGECMTCAETSIWAVMEYYGNKYSEMKQVLPSEIHKAFQKSTRVLPSEGLTVMEIASALTHFGFGSYLYARKYDEAGIEDATEAEVFRRNLFYYIESGIPIILSLQSKTIGHAVVAIGHADRTPEDRYNIIINDLLPKSTDSIVNTADIDRKLIFIDDNFPPYQDAAFSKPCAYYNDTNFADCTIEQFVVPLNHRIYLDARRASELISAILRNPKLGWMALSSNKSPLINRIFLTSTRSFKSFVLQSDMHVKLKELIQTMVLPKFVWIAELSTPELYSDEKACGLILLDATGSSRLESVKMLLYPGALMLYPNTINFDYGKFDIYRNNLKGAF